MIDLARTPEGNVRIVTSNFERLFEQADNTLKTYSPWNLPDLNRQEDFNGVVHNHGIVKDDYSGPAGDGFVLSSSEFGKAYLADGWATNFIRSILDKYVVLFIGYSADDPPVKYLLQGLNRLGNNRNMIYAFHAGSVGEADESWSMKGVKAIAYDTPEGSHSYLWDTLEAWRKRAIDLDAWYEDVFLLAENGPESLTPHQRGQLTHIVSTRVGAKKLSQREKPIPASWLCVFDSYVRYSSPGYRGGDFYSDGEWVDPFEIYGLDEDDKPEKVDPKEKNIKRERPKNAWDAFHVTEKELIGKYEGLTSPLHGFNSINPVPMPERLFLLSLWIEKLVNDPVLLWWSSRKAGVHHNIQNRIRIAMDRQDLNIDPDLRVGWGYLFEAWSNVRHPNEDFSWYEIKETIERYGWSAVTVRRFLYLLTPRLEIDESFRNLIPPKEFDGNLNNLFGLKVKYLDYVEVVEVGKEFLPDIVEGLASHVKLAVNLDNDIGGYRFSSHESVAAIIERNSVKNDYNDIGTLVDILVLNFYKLVSEDPEKAKSILYSWSYTDVSILIGIKFWAVSCESLLTNFEAGEILLQVSDKEFWEVDNQADLLHSISIRWKFFDPCHLLSLEQKLLSGPASFEGELHEKYQERKSWRILERIIWLSRNGCQFSFDLDVKRKELIDLCPSWEDDECESATRDISRVRGGIVRTNTEHDSLLDLPLLNIIDAAESNMGRTNNFLVENDPFSGLIEKYPVKAYSALIAQAKQGNYPRWAWERFLRNDFRKNDNARLVICIAYRLCQIPVEILLNWVYQFSSWTETFAKIIVNHSDKLFYQIFDKHLDIFNLDITAAKSGITGNADFNWLSKAINSPVGNLTSALLSDPIAENIEQGSGFPKLWLAKIEQLFSLNIEYSSFAYVIVARNIRWFYHIDPVWTKKSILSHLDDPIIGDAIWSGVFSASNMPQPDLFIFIKDDLIKLIKNKKTTKKKDVQALASMLLYGWIWEGNENRRAISDEEARKILLEVDDEFRTQIIWIYERWILNDNSDQVLVDSIPQFFGVVWPKHIKAKSAEISAKLFDFAMATLDKVDGIVDLVIPLMRQNENAKIRSSGFMRIDEDSLISKYPLDCLKLLHTILPEDANNWPYGVDNALPAMIKGTPSIAREPAYVELKRRWDSR